MNSKWISSYADSDNEQPAGQVSGIQAIFSNATFSNKASSMYFFSVRSYLDVDHSAIIHTQLQQHDPNLLYSINASALWLLLKDKIKKLSKIQIFESPSDKMVIKFATIYASYLSLNQAKQKVMEQEREGLRKDIKAYIQNKIKSEINRKASIQQQFNKSQFFNGKIAQDLKLNNDQKEALKNHLVQFKFAKNSTVVSFLQRCLNYLQKTIQKRDHEIRQKATTSGIEIQNLARQAYGVLLLCNYLNIYIVIGDWIKILFNDKEKKLDTLIFSHITERKGFQVINRVLDDAPLNVIAKEIKNFQSNFYK